MRRATKAGTWYSCEASELNEQLGRWLSAAADLLEEEQHPAIAEDSVVRAIIAPAVSHAGYRYSGPTAAFAYHCFSKRPAHHIYLQSVGLSPATSCETPFGSLDVDQQILSQLASASSAIKFISLKDDEDEHSLELHMPYIYHMMRENEGVQLVHMMVGDLSAAEENEVLIVRSYFEDESNVFVISSDFCHWGKRFRYTCAEDGMPIHQSIQNLDKEGMNLIEQQDGCGFRDYLKRTRNTICGRKPISLLLQILSLSSRSYSTSFLHYAQSSKCFHINDSSVSYASACVYEKKSE